MRGRYFVMVLRQVSGQSWWTNVYPSIQRRMVRIYLSLGSQRKFSHSSIIFWETFYFLTTGKSFISMFLHYGVIEDSYPTHEMPLDNLHKINDEWRLHVNVKCWVLNVQKILKKLGIFEISKLLSIYSTRIWQFYPALVANTINPSTWEAEREVDLCKFKARLVNRVSARMSSKATHRKPLFKNPKRKKKESLIWQDPAPIPISLLTILWSH